VWEALVSIPVSRNVQSRNIQTTVPPAMIERPMGEANPMHAPGINLPEASVQREPGTNFLLLLMAPTPEPGMSNPRTAGTRIVVTPQGWQQPG
jgi:hypothetical protein